MRVVKSFFAGSLASVSLVVSLVINELLNNKTQNTALRKPLHDNLFLSDGTGGRRYG
jgi:hypothetical protein